MSRVIAHCERNYKGKILDVKLRERGNVTVYEIKILSKSNFVRFIRLDAKSLDKI